MNIIRLWMAARHGDSIQPKLTTPEDLATAAGEYWLSSELDGAEFKAADQSLIELAQEVIDADLAFEETNAKPAPTRATDRLEPEEEAAHALDRIVKDLDDTGESLLGRLGGDPRVPFAASLLEQTATTLRLLRKSPLFAHVRRQG